MLNWGRTAKEKRADGGRRRREEASLLLRGFPLKIVMPSSWTAAALSRKKIAEPCPAWCPLYVVAVFPLYFPGGCCDSTVGFTCWSCSGSF